MKIEKNRVVRFHYAVSEPGQPEIETSRGGEPLAFLYGHGGIIPGLEVAMADRAAGERFETTVAPDAGYGERREDFVQLLDRGSLAGYKVIYNLAQVMSGRLRAVDEKLVDLLNQREELVQTEQQTEEFAQFRQKLFTEWTF